MAAGIFLGLAVATKWDAAWYIIGLAALGTAWDIGARRAAGLASFVRGGLREMRWLPVTFVVIPLAVYLASWSGWFATSTGYDRDYAQLHGVHTPVISPLYSLFEYHLEAIKFGLGLSSTHHYQSQPWDWLLVTRPVAFHYECYTGPVAGLLHFCPKGYNGPEWSQEGRWCLGTPAIWWGSMAALLFCLGWWLLHRGWAGLRGADGRRRALAALVPAGVARTKFYYYALEFEPFLILSIVLCLGLILGPATASAPTPLDRRGHRRRLHPVRAADVLVLLRDPGRPGHPVPRLVQPHLVPGRQRLDLKTRPAARQRGSAAIIRGLRGRYASDYRAPAAPGFRR